MNSNLRCSFNGFKLDIKETDAIFAVKKDSENGGC